MTRSSFAVAVTTMAFAIAVSPVPTAQTSATRTIYVSAVDGKGAPVLDLTAADFALKEDGRVREITTAELATTPMQVALMLDNSGFGLRLFREGAALLTNRLRGRAEIAVITTAGRNLTVLDFTADTSAVFEALTKVVSSNQSGAFLLDGFVDISEGFIRRRAPRPVIIAVVSPTEENSNVRSDAVLGALQRSRALLHIIELGAPTTTGMGSLSAKADDAGADASLRRNSVLGKAPEQTGGRAQQVIAASGIPFVMTQLADELANQYAISFTSASGATGGKLSVEVKRTGVKVRAPSRAGG